MLNNFRFRQFVYKCLMPIRRLNDWRLDNIGIYNGCQNLKRISNDQADKIIIDMIKSKTPFMLGRYGHSEFCCLTHVRNAKRWRKLLSGGGVHTAIYSQWEELYLAVSKQIDILAVWNYSLNYSAKKRLIRQTPNIKYLTNFSFLEPFEQNWTCSLAGKKVLVINPFTKSIEKQYQKADVFGIFPKLKNLSIMKPVVSYCIPGEEFDWFGALEDMKREIASRDFDIALIGCSLYSLPLAAYCKQLGKQAIVLGGITQLYFGVKGRRWVDNKYYKDKFNENWIFPLEEDIHPTMKKIENGCYIG